MPIDVYSPNGIPNKFSYIDKKIKLIIDPQDHYFYHEIDSDRMNYEFLVLLCCEPKNINSNLENLILLNGHKFDKLLITSERIKEKYPNAEIFPFGDCWVITNNLGEQISSRNNYFNIFKIENKKFKLSFIKSNKNFFPGHRFRHQVSHNLLNKYDFEIYFPNFRIQNKIKLFEDSMFHLTIENSQENNYFTEKLIDCFMSYTIPIYWGCPNIGNFFDVNGMIIINDENDLVNILNNLTENDYYSRLDYIKKNYEISMNKKYAFFFERIDDILKSL